MDLLTRWPALDVDTRRAQLRGTLSCSTAPVQNAWDAQAADASRAAAGLWRRDPAVWSADAGVGRKIADRLGWLGSPALMADAIPRLRQFAEAIRRDRFEDVVLLGMGGSSLAPEVLRSVIGVASGWPRFHMLDSTDPAAVRAVDTHPPRTLYILASKSGGTIEPNSLAAHFAGALRSSGVERWGQHFVAITDPDTALAERAGDENFRETFLNPPDIGGRYSALSYFGLVPAALMGQDLEALVGWALAMLAAAQEEPDPQKNPAVALGLLMAAGVNSRKDKLTLLLPSRLEPFGLWVEQLVAESTGKEGTGVVPIVGEPVPGRAADYSGDRVFVYSRLRGASGSTDVPAGHSDAALSSAGFPCAAIEWSEPEALGAEFVRWEIATAVAGALLKINPFDEPNVQQAKDATRSLLDSYKSAGALPRRADVRTSTDGVSVATTRAARERLRDTDAPLLQKLVSTGDYVAILAFLGPSADLARELSEFRRNVLEQTHAATMFGYGPRYLHSTGQLHKGGPNSGVFVLITATPAGDLPVPGEPYSFGTLELAQGLGDFESLDATGRRAVHVHLSQPDARLLRLALSSLLG